jgi:hypothetical protein
MEKFPDQEQSRSNHGLRDPTQGSASRGSDRPERPGYKRMSRPLNTENPCMGVPKLDQGQCGMCSAGVGRD